MIQCAWWGSDQVVKWVLRRLYEKNSKVFNTYIYYNNFKLKHTFLISIHIFDIINKIYKFYIHSSNKQNILNSDYPEYKVKTLIDLNLFIINFIVNKILWFHFDIIVLTYIFIIFYSFIVINTITILLYYPWNLFKIYFSFYIILDSSYKSYLLWGFVAHCDK